jgi:hypothetical protein
MYCYDNRPSLLDSKPTTNGNVGFLFVSLQASGIQAQAIASKQKAIAFTESLELVSLRVAAVNNFQTIHKSLQLL